MILVSKFAVQNWVITPVARAANERVNTDIRRQRWMIVLSGVVVPDLVGTSAADWRRETLEIYPDIDSPINFAIRTHAIPAPTRPEAVLAEFRTEQWAPFAGIGSVFDKDQAINAGFAVDTWQPRFGTAVDASSPTGSPPATQIFRGMHIDVAVRDSDAVLHRVGYNVMLIGNIIFTLSDLI